MKSHMKVYKVTEDTINGVCFVDAFDKRVQVLEGESFCASLPSLENGKVIGALINREQFERINTDYGIN